MTRIDDTPTPGAVASANSQSSQQATRMLAIGAYGNLPLSFEANRGQTGNQVKFLSRGPGYNLFLTPSEAVLRLRGADSDLRNEKVIHQPSDVLRLKLVGANPHSQMRGQEELPGRDVLYGGDDLDRWEEQAR